MRILPMTAGLLPALALAVAAHASVRISNHATANMNCTAGVCAPTARDAVLNTGDLAAMLAGGDVRVVTGHGAASILVADSFSWASAHRLTLDAALDVTVAAAVEVTGTGGVRILFSDGRTGGDLIFPAGGKIDFWDTASSLVVNGRSHVLVNDLATLSADVAANPAGSFALAKDYDASADGTYAHAPVTTIFGGTFEGLGHTISNLAVDNPDWTLFIGLFAQTNGAVLRDVRLAQVSIQNGSRAGALVGESVASTIDGVAVDGTLKGGSLMGGVAGGSDTGGTIMNSSATVTLEADGDGGGLVGWSYGSILRCHAGGGVTASFQAGGLAAFANGDIEDSSATSFAVATDGVAGGLVGYAQALSVARSSASGKVVADFGGARQSRHTFGDLGGLIGFLDGGSVTDSTATGEVDGVSIARATPILLGGLVGGTGSSNTILRSHAAGMVVAVDSGIAGGLIGDANATTTVAQSFATGQVRSNIHSPSNALGGLAGHNAGAIQQSYASGLVISRLTQGNLGGLVGDNEGTIAQSYATGAVNGGLDAGGLIGEDAAAAGSLAATYWDTTTGISDPSRGAGNVANDPGITGLTTAQFQAGLPAGFDAGAWGESAGINGGFPYLLANPPPQ